MATTQKPIHVPADSEFGIALRDAAMSGGGSVIVETGGATYTVEVELGPNAQSAIATRQKPTREEVARSIEGIERASGSWVGLVDGESFKAYIRERRRTSSRPPVKL